MRINDFNATGFDSVIEPSLIAKMENNGDSATLIEKTITENGEYNASADNADGYSKVTVDVAGGGGGETFEVNAVIDDTTTPPCYRTDKTVTEVLAALNNGANIVFNFEGFDTEYPFKYIIPIATSDSFDSLYVTQMMTPHRLHDNKLYTSGFYYTGENSMLSLNLVDVTAME